MAEDKKIVTKKTAAKPAVTTKKVVAKATATGAGKAPINPPVSAKKTVARPAAPKPPLRRARRLMPGRGEGGVSAGANALVDWMVMGVRTNAEP